MEEISVKRKILTLLTTLTIIACITACEKPAVSEITTISEDWQDKTDASKDFKHPIHPDLEDLLFTGTQINLGNTDYTITIPEGYYEATVTEEEKDKGMVAYYRSDEHSLNFDIYQFGDQSQSIYEYIIQLQNHGGIPEYTKMIVNGLEMIRYVTSEEYDGATCDVTNYVLAQDDQFIKVSFRMDGDDSKDTMELIMSSLSAPENKIEHVQLPDGVHIPSDQEILQNIQDSIRKVKGASEEEIASEQPDITLSGNKLFTTPDGIECVNLTITANHDSAANIDTYDFTVEVGNAPGQNAQIAFDPSLFTIETKNGQIINACDILKDVGTDADHLRSIYFVYQITNTQDLHTGDTVSVYYDNEFITKTTITGK